MTNEEALETLENAIDLDSGEFGMRDKELINEALNLLSKLIKLPKILEDFERDGLINKHQHRWIKEEINRD